MRYLGKPVAEFDPRIVERGRQALQRLEEALETSPYLVGETLSLADVALAPYTRVAGEGGFDLAPYSRVRGWIARVEAALGVG